MNKSYSVCLAVAFVVGPSADALAVPVCGGGGVGSGAVGRRGSGSGGWHRDWTRSWVGQWRGSQQALEIDHRIAAQRTALDSNRYGPAEIMHPVKYLLTLLCLCALMACAQSSSVSESAPISSASAATDKPNFGDTSAGPSPAEQARAPAQPGAAEAQSADASAPATPPPVDNVQDTTRLDALYRSRTRGETVADYPIGPG